MTADPSAAVNVPPVQVVAAPDGVATVTAAGRLSVKSRIVAATMVPLLSIVKVSVLVPPTAMGLGAKLLAKTGGGGGLTVRVSLAVPLLPDDEVGRSALRRVDRRVDALQRVLLAGSGVAVEAFLDPPRLPRGGKGTLRVLVHAQQPDVVTAVTAADDIKRATEELRETILAYA